MGLAQSRIAVDEEGIERFSWCLTHSVCGRSRQLVRLPNDEKIEGIPIAKWGSVSVQSSGCSRRCNRRADEKIHLRPSLSFLVDAKHDIQRMSQNDWSVARQ